MRPSERAQVWSTRIFLWVFLVITLFPIAWVFAVSFRAGDAFYSDKIWPEVWTYKNYVELLTKTDFSLWIWNTLKVGGVVATIQFLITATSAYAFSRLRFSGRQWGLITLLILQMFPATMILASNYILLVKLGLYNTHAGLILISSGASAYMIWMVKGFIDNIPRALDEAGMVDGATRWQVFWQIILPLTRPFMAVQVLFTLLGIFSEFINSSIFLKSPKLWLVAVGAQRFIGGNFQANRWPIFAAGAVMISLPLVIIWMILQRQLIAGLTRGAVKG